MYNIDSLKRKMLVKYPFFGSVVVNVKYQETKEVDTACTDGKIIYYNPEFLNSLSLEEQMFLLAHEVCHIAFNHILRSEGKDARLWNIATDAVINQFLMRDGLKMVEGGVDIAEAINYDAEQLYEKLLKEQQEKQHQQQNGNGQDQQKQDGQGQNGNQGQDGHNQGDQQNEQGEDGKNQEGEQNKQGGQDQQNEQSKSDQVQSKQQGGQDQQKQDGQGQSGQEGNQEQSQNENSQGENSTGGGFGSEAGSASGSGNSEDEMDDQTKNDVGHDTHKMRKAAEKKHNEE